MGWRKLFKKEMTSVGEFVYGIFCADLRIFCALSHSFSLSLPLSLFFLYLPISFTYVITVFSSAQRVKVVWENFNSIFFFSFCLFYFDITASHSITEWNNENTSAEWEREKERERKSRNADSVRWRWKTREVDNFVSSPTDSTLECRNWVLIDIIVELCICDKLNVPFWK